MAASLHAHNEPNILLHAATAALVRKLKRLHFAAPVTHVYNPLEYARASHAQYVDCYAKKPKKVLLVGMNPGPFGMAQTGVPFGEISFVKNWMKICAPVGKPKHEHPKRRVTGFDCARSEVSGARLWGWAEQNFKTPSRFFKDFFVYNYCPLAFMEESGRNRTPDKLPKEERQALYAACDKALSAVVEILQPKYVVGIGGFAYQRIVAALPNYSGTTGQMLHPSPASPRANSGWAKHATEDLRKLGIRVS